MTAFVVRPDAFRGVLNEHDSVSLAYLDQRVEVDRVAKRVHRQHGPDGPAGVAVHELPVHALANPVEVAREPVRVDAERLLARVHEMRNRPAVRDRVWGCHEGEGRGEHLVTGRHAGHYQREMQRGGPIGRRYHACHADPFGEHLLESVHV